MLTRAELSVALISEGRCWDCEHPLTPVPDGWADCPRCERRMRVADGQVFERFRPEACMLDKWVGPWISDKLLIVTDDAVAPIIMSATGRGFIPANTRWLQLSWPIPQGA